VAIKILRKAKFSSVDLISIRREISIMMECDNPDIVKIFGVDENYEFIYISNNLIYLVMEYFNSVDLHEFCKMRKYSIAENIALMLIFKIVKALDYLNSMGIIHRDVKTENILISNLGEANIKLIDFGLSRFLAKNTFVINESFGTLVKSLLNFSLLLLLKFSAT
jgi:serine/threonine protein kinase